MDYKKNMHKEKKAYLVGWMFIVSPPRDGSSRGRHVVLCGKAY